MKNIKYPCPKNSYKVLVICTTYNQANYIKDTLNGFAMQQVDFPFACAVLDDASTDGEQDVIKAWMRENCDMSHVEYHDISTALIIFTHHNKNVNCTFAFYFFKRNLWKEGKLKNEHIQPWDSFCEYEAFCDGDDYWINPKKLQTQVTYLDSHPDVSLSCTRLYDYVDGEKEMYIHHNYFFDKEENKDKETFEFDQTDAFSHGWFTHLLTCVIRLSALDKDFINTFRYSRDVHLVYSPLEHSKGVCHRMVSAVYRRNAGGVYSGNDYIGRAKIDVAVYQELYDRTHDKVIYAILKEKWHYLLRCHVFAMPTSIYEWKILLNYVVFNKRDSLVWMCDYVRVKLALGNKLRSIKKKIRQ